MYTIILSFIIIMYTIIWSFIILDVIILFDIVVYCCIILLFIVFPSQCIVLYFIVFYYIFIFVFYLCTQPISTIHYIVHVHICLYLQVLSTFPNDLFPSHVQFSGSRLVALVCYSSPISRAWRLQRFYSSRGSPGWRGPLRSRSSDRKKVGKILESRNNGRMIPRFLETLNR